MIFKKQWIMDSESRPLEISLEVYSIANPTHRLVSVMYKGHNLGGLDQYEAIWQVLPIVTLAPVNVDDVMGRSRSAEENK